MTKLKSARAVSGNVYKRHNSRSNRTSLTYRSSVDHVDMVDSKETTLKNGLRHSFTPNKKKVPTPPATVLAQSIETAPIKII